MQPGDDLDPLKENEDESAEVTDIDDALAQAGKHGDGDSGPSILGEDGIADDDKQVS